MISAGRPEAAAGVVAEVVGWATSVGSRSYARGLARLCHAAGRRFRGRDARGRRRALLLAEAIADGIGATVERAQVRAEAAEQYTEAGFDRAALLLRLLDLAEVEQQPAARADGQAWIRLLTQAVAAHRDAITLRDPNAIRSALEQLHRIGALQTDTAFMEKGDEVSTAYLHARPNFMQTRTLTPAEIGTAMHTIMQHINFQIEQNSDTIEQLITTLQTRQLITREEAKAVNIDQVTQFFKSEMAKRVKLSTQVLRELPFTYAHDGDDGDYQIIQGIADCLFEEEDGWVLIGLQDRPGPGKI